MSSLCCTCCCTRQGNHIYTSGATGTNAAVIKGALRAEAPDLLTVILPQSLSRQPQESQELLSQVRMLLLRGEQLCFSWCRHSKQQLQASCGVMICCGWQQLAVQQWGHQRQQRVMQRHAGAAMAFAGASMQWQRGCVLLSPLHSLQARR